MDFRILGPLEVLEGGRALPLGRGKQRALLALLLLRANEVVAQDRLIDELWGESPPPTAATALHGYVSRLRKLLGAERVQTQPPGYFLRLEPRELDRERFERLIKRARYHEALELWRGPPLADVAFESFVQPEIARLDELRLAALEGQIEDDLARGCDAELVGELESLVAEHPLRERFAAQLMVALYRSGRQADALDVYQATRSRLVDELGLEPSETLSRLQRQILDHDHALEPVPSVGRVRAAPRANLPAPTTSFVGRAHELAQLHALLERPEVRVVTLTGAGGTGKTRLAVEVGWARANEFADGAIFVPLSAVATPALVPAAIAQALGIRDTGESTSDAIKDFLRDRELLLLLDNLEHLLDAAPLAGELLAAAPDLTILATSRVHLNLYGEFEYAVPPLSLPDPRELPPLESLAQLEAVALFVQRAEAARPGFELSDANAESVARICTQLDGLPLAIELAAARTRTLRPDALLARLEPRLPLLSAGARDLPERQRTLRATIDWSYRLLDSDQQTVFARLAVFAGGCTLEAAERICNADLDRLTSLVDNNLLRRREDVVAAPRFTMLATIREFARERLERIGDAETLSRRHAEYFLELAERAEPELADWLDRLTSETANVRAALGWAASAGKADIYVRLAVSLRFFWLQRGDIAEGRQWLERALADCRDEDAAFRVKALEGTTHLVRRQGDHERAMALAAERLRLAREVGDDDAIAGALHDLGLLAADEGDHERAQALYEEAVQLGRRAGHKFVGQWITDLGSLARWQGDLERASLLLEESLALHRAAGNKAETAYALEELGIVALYEDRPERARALLAESLKLWQAVGATNVIAMEALDKHAAALAAHGQAEQAAQLLGAAEGLRDTMGIRPLFQQKAESPRRLATATANARLGEDAFADAFSRGQRMSLDQAIAFALEAARMDATVSSARAGR